MRLTWLLVMTLVVTAALAKVDLDAADDEEYGTVDVRKDEETPEGINNPCNLHKCKRGEVCQLEERKPVCVCQTCDEPEENEAQVCSRRNVTYVTECHLDRDHCLCRNTLPGCHDDAAPHVRLDYFSACKELTECPDQEFETFPGRMRDWLFRVMTTLAYRHELDDYQELVENAMHDKTHADAVLWKFCDLDTDPEDRKVTRRELMYIIASIKPMEHCLVPFLNSCDADDDNIITLVEWGECLGIGHEAIADKCQHKMKG
ncbi:SPARC-like isoform X2 [Mya arenaria]|uniref:SPARC-like isoform X2 n=1 Tax=Mya arenaria TaxID=6604 RepID=UPI0022E52166|nr:SPARC-like isoform X2 [Mya arenaria]XP_052815507.1 SPARC-like isoform X2 [Mya arenaria]